MGSIGVSPQGTFRFTVPDTSLTADERALYSPPGSKELVEEQLPLHDARTSSDIVKGPAGLDVQGFTFIKHRSALTDSGDWFAARNVEEIYIPEVEALVCQVTGAKRAVVNNVAFRRKLVKAGQDPSHVYKRGDDLDKLLSGLPGDIPMVVGKEQDNSLEPYRGAHIDYTLQGLRDTARYCRKDITAAAQEALAAEDAGQVAPRYAAYSVWRPVKPLKRDALAVCDWRSVEQSELAKNDYRAKSGINDSGDYLMEAYLLLPPKKPVAQRWYWFPEMQPDEVLFIKFADTASEANPDIAAASPHCSPYVAGTEEEEPRCSIECRVLAFW